LDLTDFPLLFDQGQRQPRGARPQTKKEAGQREPVGPGKMERMGVPPAQVRLATLILLFLSLLLGGAVLVSNFQTWRRARASSASSSRGDALHASLPHITTALAVASILSGVIGFAGTYMTPHQKKNT